LKLEVIVELVYVGIPR